MALFTNSITNKRAFTIKLPLIYLVKYDVCPTSSVFNVLVIVELFVSCFTKYFASILY